MTERTRGRAEVDKTVNKKQQEKNTPKGEKKGPGHRAEVERTGNENMNKKNTPKGEEKSQGHRAEVEGTGDKKQEKTPKEQQTKTMKHRWQERQLQEKEALDPPAPRRSDAAQYRSSGGVGAGWKSNQNKNTDDRSGSCSNSRQLALLHRADPMPHRTEAADWCDESSRGGEGMR
jgi:hypothetical protein